jgi:thioesterase domain-containing protein
VAYAPLPVETAMAKDRIDGAAGLSSELRPQFRKFRQCRSIALDLANVDDIHSRVVGAERSRQNHLSAFTAPRTELEVRLCGLWQSLLKLDRVGIADNFFELGGHSLLAVRLFAEIERMTGRKLPLVTLFQAPTVQALAAVLAPDKSTSRSLLVPIQPNGTKPPLFLVHGAGGDVLWGYANLAAHLGDDQPIYGIKSRGQLGLEESSTLEDMARSYIDEVRAFQPSGPYYLGGYCFGGNVAYEMARQLQQQGQEVAVVALMDSAPSNAGYETVRWWSPAFPLRFARNFGYWLADFRRLEPKARRRFVTRKAAAWARKARALLSLKGAPAAEVDLDEVIDVSHFPEHELKLWQAHLQALVSHVEQPYDGPVTLLRTRGQPLFCSLEPDFCWRALASRLAIKLVPGSHEEIFIEPHVQTLARELRAILAAAATRGHSNPPKTTAFVTTL